MNNRSLVDVLEKKDKKPVSRTKTFNLKRDKAAPTLELPCPEQEVQLAATIEEQIEKYKRQDSNGQQTAFFNMTPIIAKQGEGQKQNLLRNSGQDYQIKPSDKKTVTFESQDSNSEA